MCWECDNPESTHADYLNHVTKIIDANGWAVQAVAGDRIHPPWAYTVGLTRFGKPELVVTGLPSRRAQALLNDAAPYILREEPPAPGEQIDFRGHCLIEVVALPEPSAHLHVATDLYGPALRALQLVHQDDRGHWPWDLGYRGGRGGQPVLGPRA